MKVEQELDKLINDKQIVRLEKCPNDGFISPVVITVKKDKSSKLALDSKKLNQAIHKNKYQMQSIDHLIDAVALYISERKASPAIHWFSKFDLKYAYSQIPLDESIANYCNFSILGGRATGTYRFLNGFYGLTDMPATFQNTIDKTLEGITSKFSFLDNFLVITKRSLNEHESELDKILEKLDKEDRAKNLQKCELAKNTARLQNNSPGNNTVYHKNRNHIETRTSQNTKKTTINYGKHTSTHKTHSEISRKNRTTKTTSEKTR